MVAVLEATASRSVAVTVTGGEAAKKFVQRQRVV